MTTDTVPIRVLDAPRVAAAPARSGSRPAPRTVVGLVALALLLLGVLAAWAAGVRAFVVESPSMGRAAPVGSLVIGSARASPGQGDLITFLPPGSNGAPYTHRVVAVTADGFRTRGDINGAVDPWSVPSDTVISRADAVIPGVGWLVKVAPVVLVALVLAQVVGLFVRSPATRWSIRTAALAVGVAVVCWVQRPFSGFVLLDSAATDDGLRATVVSTALLPIRVTAVGGGHVELVSGQIGRLVAPRGVGGHVALSSQLALDPLGWAAVVLVCLLPVIAVLTVGVPVEERADAPA